MDEPLMQFGPNGLVLTVKRHLAVFTTGLSLAALLQVLTHSLTHSFIHSLTHSLTMHSTEDIENPPLG
jgi:hypothetical protein